MRLWPRVIFIFLLSASCYSQFHDPCDIFDLSICDPAAECLSEIPGKADCRCPQGYIDLSPEFEKPGRKCLQVRPLSNTGDCSVNDPLSCDSQKSEVCQFIDGRYQCACPAGYSKLSDGRCLQINECSQARLHDCAHNAQCFDKDVGYECKCYPGLVDISPDPKKPGRKCVGKVDECGDPQKYNVDCDDEALCMDTDDSYSCHCRPGFADISERYGKLPGRKCVEEINECAENSLNDCSKNAQCEDVKDGYICLCKTEFLDASMNITHFPGRICTKPSAASRPSPSLAISHEVCVLGSNNTCKVNEVCLNHNGTVGCDCTVNSFRFRDGTCRLQNACNSVNECDVNAICTNTFDSYQCKCRPGYYDGSEDSNRPGRKCIELVNECAMNLHSCHPFADCVDEVDGYNCKCKKEYVDVSVKYGLNPGRHCAIASNECTRNTTNTCDINADCVDTPDGYTCQCFDGYVDVSSLAGKQPGRICTVQTSCPKQKTDLIFLVDGSGSIGVHVFINEILRFLKEFVELFDIGSDQTRVGFIQYSDLIRHESDLNQYETKKTLQEAILKTEYLSGLTRTGAAIKHMVEHGFSERRGARAIGDDVTRVCIVITDGRSQDNVTQAAIDARRSHVNMFAVGVTDHVLANELETIAGESNRWFYVDRFRDLDSRLRSLIQKIACPSGSPSNRTQQHCEIGTQQGCDRTLNEICISINGTARCECPPAFERHPITRACGSPHCNPEIETSCPFPELCARTPFGTYRCICPNGFSRDSRSGICLKPGQSPPKYEGECETGFERNPRTGKCQTHGSCDPSEVEPCDSRKNQKCLLHPNSQFHTCRCSGAQKRHPVTDICLENECQSNTHDCDPRARCTDTDTGFLCACPLDSIDRSSDLVNKSGRSCQKLIDECQTNTHDCPSNAECIDTVDGYECRCNAGLVDFSPNPDQKPGRVCRAPVNECDDKKLNECHENAICIDTVESYKCQCKDGYNDADELQRPGRLCLERQVNECKNANLNQCSPNAICIDEPKGYRCECLPGFVDNSADGLFGRLCEVPPPPKPHQCQQASLNDCDDNSFCKIVGKESEYRYTCQCNPGFVDVSDHKGPGRKCQLEVPVCEDPQKNDCHQQAICTELKNKTLSEPKFVCRCRDGFIDQSPLSTKPGHLCTELINECLDKSLNDCHQNALCEDLPLGFTCRCPLNFIDESPELARPGRSCRLKVNECVNPMLNTCSRFAECIDKNVGYECRCRDGYYDLNPTQPGNVCKFIINECESANLNDCHKHAECIDTLPGFECRCKHPFIDQSPNNTIGRLCVFDECLHPNANNCHENAQCIDLDEGFSCVCNEGFFDNSPNPSEPGRICLEFNEDSTPPPLSQEFEDLLDMVECGARNHCHLKLNEVCVGGKKCECKPGDGRETVENVCEKVFKHYLSFYILEYNGETLVYSSKYGSKEAEGYLLLENVLKRDLKKVVEGIASGDYVTSDVKLFTHPKTVNSAWNDGIIANFTISLRNDLDKCKFWKDLSSTVKSTKNRLADGPITLFEDQTTLSTCTKVEDLCNGLLCQRSRGHVCINNVCQLDYCSDVDFCPMNSTCVNRQFKAECQCNRDLIDITSGGMKMKNVMCLEEIDINECALNLHNCSKVADCIDLPHGYTCKCNGNYVDGNINVPGRQCAALLCDLCNGHGDCIPEKNGEITCQCSGGYSGKFCEIIPTQIWFVLLVFLAILFLLLMLLCLLYFCCTSKFVRERSPWSYGYNDTVSDVYQLNIPRPKLLFNDQLSMKSDQTQFVLHEVVERKVITDVIRTETLDTIDEDITEDLNHVHNAMFGNYSMPIEPEQDYNDIEEDYNISEDYGGSNNREIDYSTLDPSGQYSNVVGDYSTLNGQSNLKEKHKSYYNLNHNTQSYSTLNFKEPDYSTLNRHNKNNNLEQEKAESVADFANSQRISFNLDVNIKASTTTEEDNRSLSSYLTEGVYELKSLEEYLNRPETRMEMVGETDDSTLGSDNSGKKAMKKGLIRS